MGERKIFISGPITGHKDYFDKFKLAEEYLKSNGYVVVNPAHLPVGLGSHDDYMDICYTMIDKCDEVFMLSGWHESIGACKEREYAASKGMPIRHQSAHYDYQGYADDSRKAAEVLNLSSDLDYDEFKSAVVGGLGLLIKEMMAEDAEPDHIIEEIVGMQVALQMTLSSLKADSDEVKRITRENLVELYEILRR